MRWLAIVVALSALLLVVAGCGGDDEAASDTTTTLTDTTTDETTTEDTTTADTTTDDTTTDDDLGDLASGECADLVESGQKLSEAFGAGTLADDDLDDVSQFFDEFADKCSGGNSRRLPDSGQGMGGLRGRATGSPGRPGRDTGSGGTREAAAGDRLDRPGGVRGGVPANHRVDDRELLTHVRRL